MRRIATIASVAASVTLFSAMPLIRYTPAEALVVSGLVAMALILSRSVPAILLAVFVGFAFAWMATPYGPGWPTSLGLPLLCWAGVAAMLSPFRPGVRWLKLGSFERSVRALMAACVVISVVALCVWYATFRPDLTDLTRNLPPLSGPLLPLAGLGFALLNAVMEEVVWRGLIMDALDEAFGPGLPALVLQAASFGLYHVHGVPRGAIGVGLAFIYGLMLGGVRRRADGLGPSIVAHFCADALIFGLLMWIAK